MFKSHHSFSNHQKLFAVPHLPLQELKINATQPILLSRTYKITSSYTPSVPTLQKSKVTLTYSSKQRKIINLSRLPDSLSFEVLTFLNIYQLITLILVTQADSPLGKISRRIFEDRLLQQREPSSLSRIILTFCQEVPLFNYPNSVSNPQLEIIKLDSQRTFFQKQNQTVLTQLLDLFCRESKIKYLQGMNQIAAYILTSICSKQNAFRLMSYIYVKAGLKLLISKQFSLLKKLNKEVQRQVMKKIPHLHQFLENNSLSTDIYTSKWFLTLFTGVFSEQNVCRVWLLFFVWGFKIMVSLAVEIFRSTFRNCQSVRFQDLKHKFIDIKRSASRQSAILNQVISNKNKSSIFDLNSPNRKRGLSMLLRLNRSG